MKFLRGGFLFVLILPMIAYDLFMKKLSLFLLVFISLLSSDVAYGTQYLGHMGQLKIIIPNIPTFDEYSVPVTADVKIADDIDWGSKKNAWNYRTRLRRGLKSGPNFANTYAVITHGCGTQCQVNWITNIETGKVLSSVGSTYGVEYKRDSRLIIADNPHFSEERDPYEYGLLRSVDYYLILDDELVLIKRLNISDIYADIDEINREKERKRKRKKEDMRVSRLNKDIRSCIRKYDFSGVETIEERQTKAKKIGRECSFTWSLDEVNREKELRITGTGELEGLYYRAWERQLTKELWLKGEREPEEFAEVTDKSLFKKCSLLDNISYKACRVHEIAELTLFVRFLRCYENSWVGLKPMRFEGCKP